MAAAATFALAAQPASALTARGDLVPHRAVYDLKLHDATDRSGIAAVDGRIVFDTTGTYCDGYAVTFRLVMRIFDKKGAAQLTDLQTSSFEAPEGFNFTVRSFANGAQTEDTRGVAVHEGAQTNVKLTQPEAKKVEIDRVVLFPTEHVNRILKAARAGEHVLQAEIYDGSEDGETVFPTLTVIGSPIAAQGADADRGMAPAGDSHERGKDDADAVAKIGKGPMWPVTVSYYKPDSPMEETTPIYQISFLLYDNGVSRRLKLDYGNFSVDGGLSDIEFFNRNDSCEAGK